MSNIIYIDPTHPNKQTYHLKPINNGIEFIRKEITDKQLSSSKEIVDAVKIIDAKLYSENGSWVLDLAKVLQD